MAKCRRMSPGARLGYSRYEDYLSSGGRRGRERPTCASSYSTEQVELLKQESSGGMEGEKYLEMQKREKLAKDAAKK